MAKSGADELDLLEKSSSSVNNKSAALAGPSHVPYFQLWRGHVAYATAWGQRVDAPTNWAFGVLSFAGAMLFAERFGHECFAVFPLAFAVICRLDAQRYMAYSASAARAMVVSKNYFEPLLVNEQQPWRQALFDLEAGAPCSPMSCWVRAWCLRYRRTYFWVNLIALALWYLKIWSSASSATDGASTIAGMVAVPVLFSALSRLVFLKAESCLDLVWRDSDV